MQNKIVLITNGSGGCGKDTMTEIMNKYVNVKKVSSIDVFKRMLKDYTFDYTFMHGKDEKYRKLLSTVKSAFIEFNDLPLKEMEKEILKFLETDDQVLLMDIREPEEIEKLIECVEQQKDYMDNIKINTVLVINNNVPIIETVNSDKYVFNYAPYDYVMDNSYTLEILEQGIVVLLKELGFEVETSE